MHTIYEFPKHSPKGYCNATHRDSCGYKLRDRLCVVRIMHAAEGHGLSVQLCLFLANGMHSSYVYDCIDQRSAVPFASKMSHRHAAAASGKRSSMTCLALLHHPPSLRQASSIPMPIASQNACQAHVYLFRSGRTGRGTPCMQACRRTLQLEA